MRMIMLVRYDDATIANTVHNYKTYEWKCKNEIQIRWN